MANPRGSIFSCGGNIDRRLVQLVPLGDENLALDDVKPGDHFRDGVLDLDARIDLDEIELVAVQIEQKFDGAGVAISGGLAEPDGGVADLLRGARAED